MKQYSVVFDILIALNLIIRINGLIEIKKCCDLSEVYDSNKKKCVETKSLEHDCFTVKPAFITLYVNGSFTTNPVNESFSIKIENCNGKFVPNVQFQINENGQLMRYQNKSNEISKHRYYNDFCLDYDIVKKQKIFKICENEINIYKCCNTSEEFKDLALDTCGARNKSEPLIDVTKLIKTKSFRKPNIKFSKLVDITNGVFLDVNETKDVKIDQYKNGSVLYADGKDERYDYYCLEKYKGEWIAFVILPQSKSNQTDIASFPATLFEILSILCLIATFVALFRKQCIKQPHIVLLEAMIICMITEMICNIMAHYSVSKYYVPMIRDCSIVLSCCLLSLIWYAISLKDNNMKIMELVVLVFIGIYFSTFVILRLKYDITRKSEEKDNEPNHHVVDMKSLQFIFVFFAYVISWNFYHCFSLNEIYSSYINEKKINAKKGNETYDEKKCFYDRLKYFTMFTFVLRLLIYIIYVVANNWSKFELIYSLLGIILCFTFAKKDIMDIIRKNYSQISGNQQRQSNGVVDNAQNQNIELPDVPSADETVEITCNMPQPNNPHSPLLNNSDTERRPSVPPPPIGFKNDLGWAVGHE